MKKLKRLICLFKGHKWEIISQDDYWLGMYDCYDTTYKCSRCGETKITRELI